MPSIHHQCLLAAQARIQSLLLEGIDNDAIVVRKLPWARHDVTLPGILLTTPGRETMPPRSGTNIRDDVSYPVLVSIVAADNQDLTTNHDRELLWRERIARAFRQQRLDGVASVWTCLIEPGDIVAPAEFLKNLFHSSLTLRFLSREPRGLS